MVILSMPSWHVRRLSQYLSCYWTVYAITNAVNRNESIQSRITKRLLENHTLDIIFPEFFASRRAAMTSTGLLPFSPIACWTSASSTIMKTLCFFSSSIVKTPVVTPLFFFCWTNSTRDWIAGFLGKTACEKATLLFVYS
jgi:hypothetical protein